MLHRLFSVHALENLRIMVDTIFFFIFYFKRLFLYDFFKKAKLVKLKIGDICSLRELCVTKFNAPNRGLTLFTVKILKKLCNNVISLTQQNWHNFEKFILSFIPLIDVI